MITPWLATDKNGNSFLYALKPERLFDIWYGETLSFVEPKDITDVEIPQWEDEPIKIKLFIEEFDCEVLAAN